MTDVRENLARFIRWVMRDLTFHRVYPATVERDHGDGTVDVLPDDEAIRGTGMQRIPVQTGVLGATSRAEPGARCLVGFANGDPRSPGVVAWEFRKGTGTVYLDDGEANLARFGDLVGVATETALPGEPTTMQVQGVVQGTVTPPPPGAPFPLPPTPFTGLATLATPIHGVVQLGAQKTWA